MFEIQGIGRPDFLAPSHSNNRFQKFSGPGDGLLSFNDKCQWHPTYVPRWL